MKIMMVIWSDPRSYLAVMSAAQTLSRRGIDVEILYRTPDQDTHNAGKLDFGTRTRLVPVGSGRKGWRDKLDFTVFLFAITNFALRGKPDAVIGCNMLGIIAAFLATRLCPGTKLIYHNFDFDVSAKKDARIPKRMLNFLELAGARRSDLVIFPHPGRAAVFKEAAQLKREPLTVMNCYPLSTARQKTGELESLLRDKGLRFDRLVVRLGMIGRYHGIEATIRSVLEWKGNWGLILAGYPDNTSYLNEMRKLTNDLKLDKRIIFLPSVSYGMWYDCLYSAHLGISLYEPFNLSHSYMSGTSQKLNNYFVAGIPSVVSNSPDFISFAERFGTSKVADPSDPHSIAQAVNALLADPEEYEAYCRNVKNAFNSEFNFEKQFEPVLSWLDNRRLPQEDGKV